MSNSSLLHHLLIFFTVLRVREQELSVLLPALGVCHFMSASAVNFTLCTACPLFGLAYLFTSLFLESESKNCRFLARHSVCANIMFAFSIHVQATGQELKFCACFVHSRYKYTLCTPLTPRVPLGSRFALGVRKILHVSFPMRNLRFLILRLVCAELCSMHNTVSCSFWFSILALGVCKDCFKHLLSYARFLLVPCIALGVRSKSAFHASYT